MKALGGCSSMNAMIYMPRQPSRLRSLARQYGAAGWGYDDVLPYFIRAEGNTRVWARLTTGGTGRCTSRTAATPTS